MADASVAEGTGEHYSVVVISLWPDRNRQHDGERSKAEITTKVLLTSDSDCAALAGVWDGLSAESLSNQVGIVIVITSNGANGYGLPSL